MYVSEYVIVCVWVWRMQFQLFSYPVFSILTLTGTFLGGDFLGAGFFEEDALGGDFFPSLGGPFFPPPPPLLLFIPPGDDDLFARVLGMFE